jgi:hypothetical protein
MLTSAFFSGLFCGSILTGLVLTIAEQWARMAEESGHRASRRMMDAIEAAAHAQAVEDREWAAFKAETARQVADVEALVATGHVFDLEEADTILRDVNGQLV